MIQKCEMYAFTINNKVQAKGSAKKMHQLRKQAKKNNVPGELRVWNTPMSQVGDIIGGK